MAKHTPRDHVWSFAMNKALNGESLKVKVVQYALADPPSERTIRDTLNTMYDMELLDKENEQSHEWHPGPALQPIKLEDNQPVSNTW
jgi:hypothetical protein